MWRTEESCDRAQSDSMNTRYLPAAIQALDQALGCGALPAATPGNRQPATQGSAGTGEEKRSRTAGRHSEEADRKALERAENEGLAEPLKREPSRPLP